MQDRIGDDLADEQLGLVHESGVARLIEDGPDMAASKGSAERLGREDDLFCDDLPVAHLLQARPDDHGLCWRRRPESNRLCSSIVTVAGCPRDGRRLIMETLYRPSD